MLKSQLPDSSEATALLPKPDSRAQRCGTRRAQAPSRTLHSQAKRNRSLAWRFRLLSVGWLAGCLLLAGFCVSKAFDSQPTIRTRQVAVQKWERRQTRMDQVREGDLVLARDEYGTEVSAKPVTRLFRSTSDHLRILTFRAADGTEQVIKTTDEHPFWIEQEDDYVEAKHLKVGDEVIGPGGEIQTLASSTYEPHPEGVPVFNFEVDEFHTYFVAQDEHGLAMLVHNTCAGKHHFIPHALGNPIAYGHRSLSRMTGATHTRLHAGLDAYLKSVGLFAKKGYSGAAIRSGFTPTQRIALLDTFYRTFEGGRYYAAFRMELNVVRRLGGLVP